MQPIVNTFPVGNTAFGICNDPLTDPCTDEFVHQGATTINEDSWMVRLDHRLSPKTSIYARISRDVSNSAAPLGNLLDNQGISTNPANYLIALTHSFSNTVFNEVKFGINRAPFLNPQLSILPYAVNTNNFEGLNNNNTDHEIGTTFSYIDNLSIVRGKHTFKTGIEVRRIRLNQGITEDNIYNFTDNASLINDQLDSAFLRKSWCCRGLRRWFVLPYFEDEWKAKPNLTLSLGLRWEYYSVITEVLDRMTVFDLEECHGICSPGSPAYFPNHKNWDPRIGLAWAPSALHDKTVIRTGFGIYSGAGQNDDVNAALESNTTRISVSSSDVPGLAFPVDLNSFSSKQFFGPRALQRHRRDIYVEQWGLSVQQALPKDFVFQTSYMGSHGVRLFARNYENLCFFESNPCIRPLSNFGAVDIKRNNGTSSFNALNLSLQRYLTKGWQWESQYMWSHSINDGSVGGGEANAPENANCRPCDRGPSVFDIRHNFVSTTTYELPFGPGHSFLNRSGALGKVLGGWSLSGNGVWHTGHPLTVLIGLDCSVIPDGNCNADQRPDLLPGVPVIPANQGPGNWININAFASPPLDAKGFITHYGNAPRGIIRAPHVWQVDVGLTKTTSLTERTALEFRVEAFNLFNHVQLGDPSNLDILSPDSFGVINSTVNFNNNNDSFAPGNTGTGLPRQIEFMLRLKF
ncbi:MAG TPA: TonB-dependent receptor [Candidatus Sulfotelmatobacter sp.]|nr:TonB-dependent receptor [Candidatus Sulfotelmatobacter sp.]